MWATTIDCVATVTAGLLSFTPLYILNFSSNKVTISYNWCVYYSAVFPLNWQKWFLPTGSDFFKCDKQPKIQWYSIQRNMIEGIKHISTLAKLQNPLLQKLCLFDALQNCFLIDRNMHYFARVQIEESNTWEIKEALLPFDTSSFLHYGSKKKERGSRDWQVWIQRVQVCIAWELALPAAAYLWEPNGSLPQADSLCSEQEQR